MRAIKTHIVNGESVNSQLIVEAIDEPEFGVNHSYKISYGHFTGNMDTSGNAHINWIEDGLEAINFHKGPIKEVGINGITNEALLAIVIDRLESFQKGPLACEENAIALSGCTLALAGLHSRTKKRIEGGVEGTHKE